MIQQGAWYAYVQLFSSQQKRFGFYGQGPSGQCITEEGRIILIHNVVQSHELPIDVPWLPSGWICAARSRYDDGANQAYHCHATRRTVRRVR